MLLVAELQQDAGDQETRQDEEEIDAKPTKCCSGDRQPGEVMMQNDSQYRDAAETVQFPNSHA